MAQQIYAVADALPPLTHLATLNPPVTRDLESTYQILLKAQDKLAESNETKYERKLKHMDLKVLGFLLLDLWQSQSHLKLGPTPVHKVTKDIKSAHDNLPKMIALGTHYRETLLRAFRSNKGPTPQPSNHPSRPSFDTTQDMINDCLVESSADYRQAKQLALARDSFRCLATGIIDEEWAIKSKDLQAAAQVVGGLKLECCHILAQSTTQLEHPEAEGSLDRRNYASSVLSILRNFGLGAIVDIVEAGGIHHLCNILTLTPPTHSTFDSLNLWFEATGRSDQYKICCAYPFHLVGCGIPRDKIVTFTVNPEVSLKSKKPVSLPSSCLLALHATCCRVAHMSGAAEHFNDIDRRIEDTLVLAEDGSSGFTLISALQQALPLVSSR